MVGHALLVSVLGCCNGVEGLGGDRKATFLLGQSGELCEKLGLGDNTELPCRTHTQNSRERDDK